MEGLKDHDNGYTVEEPQDHYDSTFQSVVDGNNIDKDGLLELHSVFIEFQEEKSNIQGPLIIERKNILKEAYSNMLLRGFTVEEAKDIDPLIRLKIISKAEYNKVLDYLEKGKTPFVIGWDHFRYNNLNITYSDLRNKGVELVIYEGGLWDGNIELNDDLLSLGKMRIELEVEIKEVSDEKNIIYTVDPIIGSGVNKNQSSILVSYNGKSYTIETKPYENRALKAGQKITVYGQVNEDGKIYKIIGIK